MAIFSKDCACCWYHSSYFFQIRKYLEHSFFLKKNFWIRMYFPIIFSMWFLFHMSLLSYVYERIDLILSKGNNESVCCPRQSRNRRFTERVHQILTSNYGFWRSAYMIGWYPASSNSSNGGLFFEKMHEVSGGNEFLSCL